MHSNSSLKDMKLGEYLKRKNQRIGENLEQIEKRTSAKKSAIFVCRFAPYLNEHAPVRSIPLTVQKVAPKLTDDERHKESSIKKGEILILPMTNQSVLPLPTPPFDLSTEECEDASDKRTEAAKLAEEFAIKKLTLQERMNGWRPF
ncbi:hypothetical protein niasHT_033607 [Heterodera trifolii]|uniref:Uncharacterized protein n=1 Tax=Heterodera trifolii TaxID=157864 RepID=A0ABD2IBL9_9BILA